MPDRASRLGSDQASQHGRKRDGQSGEPSRNQVQVADPGQQQGGHGQREYGARHYARHERVELIDAGPDERRHPARVAAASSPRLASVARPVAAAWKSLVSRRSGTNSSGVSISTASAWGKIC